jgi:hypothetical protein
LKRSHLLLLILFAVSPIVYFPFAQWFATTRFGSSLLLWGYWIYIVGFVAALWGVPFSAWRLVVKKDNRFESGLLLAVSLLMIGSVFIGGMLGLQVRMVGMEACALRARPLIAAIEAYERDKSSPPTSLNSLVPIYLPAVPSTGMGAYPEFRYYIGPVAEEEFFGNPWALEVFTPNVGINFDRMLYVPKRNYPKQAFDGTLRPVGEWAYVFE